MDWGQPMYVIMLADIEEEKKIIEAFEAGANDYVTKPMITWIMPGPGPNLPD